MEKVGTLVTIGQSNNAFYNGPVHVLQFRKRVQYIDLDDYSLQYGVEPFNFAGGPTLPGIGNLYDTTKPMSAWQTYLADILIDRGIYERVVLIALARGGVNASTYAVGGARNYLIYTAAAAAKKYGLTVNAILWHQGENDAGQSTTQASYVASVQSAQATFVNAQITAKFFVCQATWLGYGLGPNSSAIRAAQAQLVDNVTFFSLVDTDAYDNDYRRDGTHFNTAGEIRLANDAFTVLQATL